MPFLDWPSIYLRGHRKIGLAAFGIGGGRCALGWPRQFDVAGGFKVCAALSTVGVYLPRWDCFQAWGWV
jgi:hypothetical protein